MRREGGGIGCGYDGTYHVKEGKFVTMVAEM
jgi:hypothetical protein